MIEDLDLLASRITQLTELATRLRAENEKLSQDLVQRYMDIHRLREALSAAHQRVDAVLSRLPGADLETPPEPPEAAADPLPVESSSNNGEAYGTP